MKIKIGLITSCLLLMMGLLNAQSVQIGDKIITIFLIGNSTVADKPYKGGNPEKGWGQVFPLYFKEGVRVENHAINGRSTKSFIDEGRWDSVQSRLKPGDYVFIEFGHNDAKKEDPTRYAAAETDYKSNLVEFIREAKSKGAIPVLATPIVRRKFENGLLIDTHGKYPQSVREVAKDQKVALFDLHEETRTMVEAFGEEKSKLLFLHIETYEYDNLKNNINDDTHLSAYGAFKVSDLVVEGLRKNFKELSLFLKD